MKKLTIFIDVYGKIGLCEEFPNDEEHCGLNEMLKFLSVEENFYGDMFPELRPGFYKVKFHYNCSDDIDEYLEPEEIYDYYTDKLVWSF